MGGAESLKFYRAVISEKARRDIKKMDKQEQRLIMSYIIEKLDGCTNPRNDGKALMGNLGHLWSYRVGNYRVLAEIDDGEITIKVVGAGHRKQIYRKI